MSFVEDYLRHEVTVAGRGTTGVDGKWLYNGTIRTVNARVVRKEGVIKLPSGKEHGYQFEVYLGPDDPITLGDKITYNDVDYRVMDVLSFDFLDGSPSHRMARVG